VHVFFKNALLQETSEEWEQCEKKMKDVRSWIDKTRQALESPQNKKRPLRDQLGLREKMVSDINVQKTKISISVEKLQVSDTVFRIYRGIYNFFNTLIGCKLCIGSGMENIKRNVKTQGKFKI
jgi:hypothetical protein